MTLHFTVAHITLFSPLVHVSITKVFWTNVTQPRQQTFWTHVGPTWILSAPRWANVGPSCIDIWANIRYSDIKLWESEAHLLSPVLWTVSPSYKLNNNLASWSCSMYILCVTDCTRHTLRWALNKVASNLQVAFNFVYLRNYMYFYSNVTVLEVPFDKRSALFQVMTWRQTVDKPSVPVMTQMHCRIYASPDHVVSACPHYLFVIYIHTHYSCITQSILPSRSHYVVIEDIQMV